MNDWMDRAACAGGDLDFYEFAREEPHPMPGVDWALLGPLVRTCVTCPVIFECAAFSIRAGAVEQYGVWAGVTPAQRYALAGRAEDPVGAIVEQASVNAAEYAKRRAQLTLEEATA